MLYVNVELNPLAAQHFESGRPSEAAALINRQLEKSLKESRCVDLESLCIVADKKVCFMKSKNIIKFSQVNCIFFFLIY